VPELHIPPPVLCLTVARGCNSEWCLLLCGQILHNFHTKRHPSLAKAGHDKNLIRSDILIKYVDW